MKFMKKVVTACLCVSIAYVVVAILFQVITGEELSPTLTECFLGGVIAELAATAIIKVGEGWIDSWRIKHTKDYDQDNSQVDEFDDPELYDPDQEDQFEMNIGE